MIFDEPHIDRLNRVLATPNGGVLGLVDELLAASSEQDLRLTWQSGHCRVEILSGAASDNEVRMRKSVIRAVLARIAALCHEQNLQGASQYGGQGELAIPQAPGVKVRVSYMNTAESQILELVADRAKALHRHDGQPLAATLTANDLQG